MIEVVKPVLKQSLRIFINVDCPVSVQAGACQFFAVFFCHRDQRRPCLICKSGLAARHTAVIELVIWVKHLMVLLHPALLERIQTIVSGSIGLRIFPVARNHIAQCLHDLLDIVILIGCRGNDTHIVRRYVMIVIVQPVGVHEMAPRTANRLGLHIHQRDAPLIVEFLIAGGLFRRSLDLDLALGPHLASDRSDNSVRHFVRGVQKHTVHRVLHCHHFTGVHTQCRISRFQERKILIIKSYLRIQIAVLACDIGRHHFGYTGRILLGIHFLIVQDRSGLHIHDASRLAVRSRSLRPARDLIAGDLDRIRLLKQFLAGLLLLGKFFFISIRCQHARLINRRTQAAQRQNRHQKNGQKRFQFYLICLSYHFRLSLALVSCLLLLFMTERLVVEVSVIQKTCPALV